MRIFVHPSFSILFDRATRLYLKNINLLPTPATFGAVSREINYASRVDAGTIAKWVAAIRQMASSSPPEVSNHYADTLAALSRMVGHDVDKTSEVPKSNRPSPG
jgi:hypothetical protein